MNGEPLAGPSQQLAMEFTLETHAGRTRLRIVHSGFGDGASWDDELESVSGGWQFELRGLRHYLEHHKGCDRHYAAAHLVTSLAADDVWTRLLGPAAFPIAEGSLTQGEHVVDPRPRRVTRSPARLRGTTPDTICSSRSRVT